MKHLEFTVKGLFAVALLFVAQTMFAQSLRTGYFMDGNLFRYRINPAFMGERSYFSIPLLGGVSVTTEGNIGFSDIFHESPLGNNDYVFFTHNSVDTKDFLGGLNTNNDIHLNTDLTLFSAGFRARGGYMTLDLTMRSRVALNIPYDLFRFMKVANPMLDDLINGRIPDEDMGPGTFNAGNLNFNTRNYLDFSAGYAFAANEHLNLGFRAKVIAPIGYADVGFDEMNINYDNIDRWNIQAHGAAKAAMGGQFKYDDRMINGVRENIVMGHTGYEFDFYGFGLGLDFGFTYDLSDALLDGLKVSGSLNDLGFIYWDGVLNAEMAGETYSFEGFNRLGIITGTESIDDQINDLTKDLGDFLAMREGEEESFTSGLGAKLNIGAEYEMPFYKKLSVGALYTHCFDDFYSYDQTSLVLTVSPLAVCDFALSSTFADYGTRFGAMANFHFTGFSFFVGTDCMLSDLSDSKYPFPNDNLNANLSLGVNISFAKAKK